MHRRTVHCGCIGMGALAFAGLCLAAIAPDVPVAKLRTGRPAASSLGYEKDLLIQLRVVDLDRAVRFYRDVMDFDLVLLDESLQWAKMDPGIPGVIVGVGVGPKVAGSGTLSMNFGVTDIEKARKLLEKRGVVFTGPTITIPDVVKLADFADPDGNRIRLAQDLGG